MRPHYHAEKYMSLRELPVSIILHRKFDRLDPDRDVQSLLAMSNTSTVVLFKHSISCPSSSHARRQLQRLTEYEAPLIIEIVVQQEKQLSHDIAEHLGIRHETPQVTILREGKFIFHASYWNVSAEKVREALLHASDCL